LEPKPGSARVFVRTNPESNVDWEQQGDPLIVDDGDGGVYEGYRVAIDGDTALISVRNVESWNAGLFVFERTGDVWKQTAILHKSTPHYGDEDILRIALEGNTGKLLISFNFNALESELHFIARRSLFVLCPAVVGQPIDHGDSHGTVYVYTRLDDGTWIDEPQVLTGDEVIGDYFGDDVAISNDQILVGATERVVFALNDDGSCCNYTDYTSPQRGKAFMFVNNGGTWVQEGGPLYPDDEATDPRFHFGAYVALDGDTAIIGHDSDNGGMWWDVETGQMYHSNLIVYGFSRTSGGNWELVNKLTPPDVGNGVELHPFEFGRGVELKGNQALVEGNINHAILFVDWQYVKTEQAFGFLTYHRSRTDHLALKSNEFFLGSGHGGINFIEGRINVIDNFSILPVSVSRS
jgi:hypothetical protein